VIAVGIPGLRRTYERPGSWWGPGRSVVRPHCCVGDDSPLGCLLWRLMQTSTLTDLWELVSPPLWRPS